MLTFYVCFVNSVTSNLQAISNWLVNDLVDELVMKHDYKQQDKGETENKTPGQTVDK